MNDHQMPPEFFEEIQQALNLIAAALENIVELFHDHLDELHALRKDVSNRG